MDLTTSLYESSAVRWGAVAAVSLMITAAVAQPAQSSLNKANLTETVIFYETFDPPGDDSPRRTSGLGSRDGGRCALEEQPVQALMPANNFGLTFAERPTVTVQLPETTSAQRLILTVTDEEGLYYAEADFWVANQTGIINLSLSDQTQPLTIGRNYRWHVVVVCDEQPDPDNPVLVGWVQRVAETVLEPQDTPLKQAQWLAKNGYWYDMLAIIMGELKEHPSDPHLQAIWESVVLSPIQD